MHHPPPPVPALPQLAPVYDHVAPCFPPAYRIFGVVAGEHHRQLASMVDFIGLCADNLANADILKVGGLWLWCGGNAGGSAAVGRLCRCPPP